MRTGLVGKFAGGILLLIVGFPASAQPAGDGAKAFAQCSACHSLDAAKRGIGPNLAHVVGRKAGSVQGYQYSSAMRSSGIVWTRNNLDAFLEHPQTVVKGTKMPFAGIADAKARAALISFLSQH